MRKILIVTAAILSLAACDSGPARTGQGTVTEVEYEPAKYKCVQYSNTTGKCVKQKKTKNPEWEIDYIDTGTGEEREAKVTPAVLAGCKVKMFYNGKTCE